MEVNTNTFATLSVTSAVKSSDNREVRQDAKKERKGSVDTTISSLLFLQPYLPEPLIQVLTRSCIGVLFWMLLVYATW